MSLLCRLGRHKPRGIPRWNDGLYFAKCERCGLDLVRTAFQRWHVPSGYRIVWSERPPASRPEVALMPKESAPATASGPSAAPAETVERPEPAPVPALAPPEAVPAAPSALAGSEAEAPGAPAEAAEDLAPAPAPVEGGGRLPIQDVLAHLAAQESADRAGETPPPAPEAPARRRRSSWDFMDEDPFEEDRGSRPEPGRAPTGQSGAAPAVAPAPPTEAVAATRARDGGGETWRRFRSALRNFWSGPEEPKPLLVTGLALALAVAVALAFYAAGSPGPTAKSPVPGGEGAQEGGRPDPFAASAPHVPPGEAGPTQPGEDAAGAEPQGVAYVAASLLSCREAPVLQARRVRNLARGQEVQVLGFDGAWASLAYRGGQCWAQAQYLSPVPPLQGAEG